MLITSLQRRACRCRACGARQMKAMHPDEYQVRIRCKRCRRFDTLRIDQWADRREWRKQTCRCDGYHFPHRRNSKWCNHNPDYPIDEQRVLYA